MKIIYTDCFYFACCFFLKPAGEGGNSLSKEIFGGKNGMYISFILPIYCVGMNENMFISFMVMMFRMATKFFMQLRWNIRIQYLKGTYTVYVYSKDPGPL